MARHPIAHRSKRERCDDDRIGVPIRPKTRGRSRAKPMNLNPDDRRDGEPGSDYAHLVRGRHTPDVFQPRRARKPGTRPARDVADDRKTLQLCKQAANALGEALMEFELAMVEGDLAGGSIEPGADEVAATAALAPAATDDDSPPPPDVSLYVESVEPYPNASRLRVIVVASTEDPDELTDLRARVATAQPFLRAALARAISRRRVPELLLVVVPESAIGGAAVVEADDGDGTEAEAGAGDDDE